ncbi:hypothetical protein JYU34_003258 [Plutella xylostella]|uniref:Protein rolling stone-like n=1 Tax=Plutella xylostella TaxID=51655 RepID=A0ABQ7QZL0_PLUXY|nr:hypothetical protein JYU34_003258 [Plutella xylostella]
MTQGVMSGAGCACQPVEAVTAETFARSWSGVSALAWRVPLLAWALLVVAWSGASFWGPPEMWFLYMTHWGLLFILLEMVFGVIVAAVKTPEKNPDEESGLPWYVRVYWLLYNITIPVAFLITIFYWCILKPASKNTHVNYAPNPVLDVMLHGVNSVAMLVELALSRHPSRLLDVVQPWVFASVYMFFTLIYFFAGGLDPWGNAFIYPVVDWSKPEQTAVVITLTGLFLTLMHLATIGLASLRDRLIRRCRRDSAGVYNEGFTA